MWKKVVCAFLIFLPFILTHQNPTQIRFAMLWHGRCTYFAVSVYPVIMIYEQDSEYLYWIYLSIWDFETVNRYYTLLQHRTTNRFATTGSIPLLVEIYFPEGITNCQNCISMLGLDISNLNAHLPYESRIAIQISSSNIVVLRFGATLFLDIKSFSYKPNRTETFNVLMFFEN